MFNVKLTVGNREFVGQGGNQRLARQDAAGKAMKSIEESPIPVKKDQVICHVTVRFSEWVLNSFF